MNDKSNRLKIEHICKIEDANDGSGDGILTFPPELIEKTGWKEGTILNLKIDEHGNLIVSEKVL
jgi:hypothetical protein